MPTPPPQGIAPGTCSWVLVGTDTANNAGYYECRDGNGNVYSDQKCDYTSSLVPKSSTPSSDANPTTCHPPGPHEQLINSDPKHCAYSCDPDYKYDDIDTSKCVPKPKTQSAPQLIPTDLASISPQYCEARSAEHLVVVKGSYPPNCQWRCEDGYGPVEGGTCTPCADICKSKGRNEIPDPAKCVNAQCGCTCDTANGYRYNNQGECVNDLENALINALKGNDVDATERVLIPYLKNDDPKVRRLALAGILESYKNNQKLSSDVAVALENCFRDDKDLFLLSIEWGFNTFHGWK